MLLLVTVSLVMRNMIGVPPTNRLFFCGKSEYSPFKGASLNISDSQVLHPQSMRPARESDIPVRVKNSYNPKAPGTLISKSRDMSKVCSIYRWYK